MKYQSLPPFQPPTPPPQGARERREREARDRRERENRLPALCPTQAQTVGYVGECDREGGEVKRRPATPEGSRQSDTLSTPDLAHFTLVLREWRMSKADFSSALAWCCSTKSQSTFRVRVLLSNLAFREIDRKFPQWYHFNARSAPASVPAWSLPPLCRPFRLQRDFFIDIDNLLVRIYSIIVMI